GLPGFTNSPIIGGTLTVQGETFTSASTTSRSGLNVAPGTAPTSPVNGDLWTTSGGAFAQINGTTVPLGGAAAFANPTALVGPTATNGSALTALRSDSAPAINLTSTYPWTGNHSWQVPGMDNSIKLGVDTSTGLGGVLSFNSNANC